MRRQTSVEWLFEKMTKQYNIREKEAYELFHVANKMHKYQIESAYSYLHFEEGGELKDIKLRAESYYDAFYGDEK